MPTSFTHPFSSASSHNKLSKISVLDYGPYPPSLKKLIDSDIGHMSNLECAKAVKRTMHNNGRKIFLGHLSRHNNTPDIAKDTISEITGLRRFRFDCLEYQGDTRILKP